MPSLTKQFARHATNEFILECFLAKEGEELRVRLPPLRVGSAQLYRARVGYDGVEGDIGFDCPRYGMSCRCIQLMVLDCLAVWCMDAMVEEVTAHLKHGMPVKVLLRKKA
jgi:hypothetical protein